MKTDVFYRGYEAKTQEIKEMGFEASRDQFNSIYPPGQKWTGSVQGLEYAQGEFEAIFKYKVNPIS